MIERVEMEVLCGVDGCRGGWVAAIDTGSGIAFEVFKAFSDILRRVRGKKSVVVVDVPIRASRCVRPWA